MATSFGMMSEAYFVGKNQLLAWINEFLALGIKRVEELANGAVYCQLLDALYPGKVAMKKVDFTVKTDFEFIKNWKIVQNTFNRMDVSKHIPVERIIRARYQDNLEFLQWFYQYFNNVYNGNAYDAVSRRRQCRGGKKFVSADKVGNHLKRRGLATGTIAGEGATEVAPPSYRQNANGDRIRERRTRTRPAPQRGAGPPMKKRRAGDSSEAVKALTTKLEAQAAKMEKLDKDHSELVNVARDIEKERDFYFKKVVSVEQLCKSHPDQELELLKSIYKVLYQTDDANATEAPPSSGGDLP